MGRVWSELVSAVARLILVEMNTMTDSLPDFGRAGTSCSRAQRESVGFPTDRRISDPGA